MPYEQLDGVHISGEEIYAATPNWLQSADEVVSEQVVIEQEGATPAGEPA